MAGSATPLIAKRGFKGVSVWLAAKAQGLDWGRCVSQGVHQASAFGYIAEP